METSALITCKLISSSLGIGGSRRPDPPRDTLRASVVSRDSNDVIESVSSDWEAELKLLRSLSRLVFLVTCGSFRLFPELVFLAGR